jgi:aryl-alcohol dehydrogenase-like predicted oxidoreductase
MSWILNPETIRVGDRAVYRLGFGAMRLCGPGITGWPADRENALAVLRRAVELGVQLIDTADAYGPEVNELQIAEALHPYPDDLLIATKGGLVRDGSGGDWPTDGRPEHIKEACDASLRRLRLDTIELYQFHRPDPKVPYAESIGAFKELRDEGKIRHVGVSNVSLDQLEIARSIVPIVSVQNEFNSENRASEDVLEVCERDGIAFLPYAPVGAGSLEPQAAIRWLLERSPVMLPIPGTSSLEHLEENMRAAG